MIELPRACVRADEIAAEADFLSFGTNDLTQTTLGFSRDDAEGKFLTHYLEDRILESNPFETLDVSGVGELMRIAVELKRKIAFAMLMGVVTTGIISFVLVAVNLGMDSAFLRTWLRCWLISYLIVIPAILLVGPRTLRQMISLKTRSSAASSLLRSSSLVFFCPHAPSLLSVSSGTWFGRVA